MNMIFGLACLGCWQLTSIHLACIVMVERHSAIPHSERTTDEVRHRSVGLVPAPQEGNASPSRARILLASASFRP